MAPAQTSGAARGRPKGTKNASKPRASRPPPSSNPFASSDEEPREVLSSGDDEDDEGPSRSKRASRGGEEAEEADGPEKTIPKELLTRLLHEFFAKDATRISKDANSAAAKYMDIFVREAIARTAVEKQGGFLEVSIKCLARFLVQDLTELL
jgi:solute carrier family 25 (adenine nucleotide translocator) protein 4/5/6/31